MRPNEGQEHDKNLRGEDLTSPGERGGWSAADAEAACSAASERVTEWKGFTLSTFQIKAVAAIRAGHNVLVSAPTGAGKTLVAEYAMADSVRLNRRCIYTSPVKALSNQKYRDFRDDPDVDVGIMTGDVTIHPTAQVLVMTTEILRNAIFESPDLLADVEYVIFDEIHYLDDRERGTVWEESLIFLPAAVRLICLSATISNVDEVGSWLADIRSQEIEVIHSENRPVPLSHWVHTEATGSFDCGKLDAVLKRESRALAEDKAADRGNRRSRRGRGGRGGRGGRSGGRDDRPRPGPLLDSLQEDKLLPALVFSFSRKDCERLASQNDGRSLLDAQERKRMLTLQHELVGIFGLNERELDGEIFAMARNGVGYHHAGMLPVYKEVVERMFTAGLLKMLFTTETFALGINMPARTVVFNALRKFDGVTFDWLRTRDYMQIAGRAGRQGIDKKGYVFSLLSRRDLVEAPLKRMVAGRPEPVNSRFRLAYSTLLHLVDSLGRERVHEAYGKSFHQYQARDKNKKARERQVRQQRRTVEGHLDLLEDLAYLKGDDISARGRIACLLSGYEIQVTEMLFRGYLEDLPPEALAVIFVGMIHEERRRFDRPYVPDRMFGKLRDRVTRLVGELRGIEVHYGVEPLMKFPDWGLTPAILAWCEGCTVEDLAEVTEATPGDVCRVFRMAIQLMRNVRRATDPDWDIHQRLKAAVDLVNRDEIDARRQLALG